jgi:hypothetical protein
VEEDARWSSQLIDADEGQVAGCSALATTAVLTYCASPGAIAS